MEFRSNYLCILAVFVCIHKEIGGDVQVPIPDDGEVEPRCPEVSPIDQAGAKLTRLFCSKLKSGKPITVDDLKPEYDVSLVKIGNGFYHFGGLQEPLSWYSALRYCYQHKLKLVAFETKEEFLEVNHHVMAAYGGGMHFWTGGSDLELYNGQYFWITNGLPVDTKFLTVIPAEKEPDTKHCLVYNLYSSMLSVETCYGLSGVLCEKP